MKWFKHYANAHDNNKLTKVRMKYGAEGYAIYWYCLELIAHDLESENITFELKHDAEVIAYNLKVDSQRVQEIMTYMVNLGLFEMSNNVITCLKIAKHLDAKYTRNPELLKIIKSIKDGSKFVPDCPRQSPDSPRLSPIVPDCPSMSPPDKNRLDKNRKEKDLSNSDELDFLEFWKIYPRKDAKKKSKPIWDKLSRKTKQTILEDLKTRYNGIDKKFIPLPTTYLNGERWNDEKPNSQYEINCI